MEFLGATIGIHSLIPYQEPGGSRVRGLGVGGLGFQGSGFVFGVEGSRIGCYVSG